jgi:replicative DNA helicase
VYAVALRLEGGAAYLIAIANAVPADENIGHYARLVKEKPIVRRMIAACAEIQSCGYGDFGEFGQFLDESGSAVSSTRKAWCTGLPPGLSTMCSENWNGTCW